MNDAGALRDKEEANGQCNQAEDEQGGFHNASGFE
jgi:hypothetical protein